MEVLHRKRKLSQNYSPSFIAAEKSKRQTTAFSAAEKWKQNHVEARKSKQFMHSVEDERSEGVERRRRIKERHFASSEYFYNFRFDEFSISFLENSVHQNNGRWNFCQRSQFLQHGFLQSKLCLSSVKWLNCDGIQSFISRWRLLSLKVADFSPQRRRCHCWTFLFWNRKIWTP